MKLVNFKSGEKIGLGIKVDKGIIDVEKTASINSFCVPTTMQQVIERGKDGLLQLEELSKKQTKLILEDDVAYAPCIVNPEKIICVGLNYISHSEECGIDIPKSPVLFSKFNNSLAAHKQLIKLPNLAKKFDYEAELVIIIGKETKNVSKEDALSCVFGYTVGNDISARDLQMLNGQWLLGKTCDDFAPIGPYLVTADEINPNNLEIKCKVNGEVRQSSNTHNMIFDCATIISYISQYMTLKPGDIIFTGTPEGVILGYPEEKQCWLKSGDVLEVSIEKIGTLTNELK